MTDRPIHYAVPLYSGGHELACGADAGDVSNGATTAAQHVTCRDCRDCWGYREPGHSHTIKQVCTPESCTGHPDWQRIRQEQNVAEQEADHRQQSARTSRAQTDADKVRDRCVSELQRQVAELEDDRNTWRQRAETAEGILAAAQDHVQALGRLLMPPLRIVLSVDGDPSVVDWSSLWSSPGQIVMLPEGPNH